MITTFRSTEDLVAALSELPPILVSDATGQPLSHLPEVLLDNTLGKLEPGERLVLSAGLITSAIYLRRISNRERDHRMDDMLRSILQDRYGLGIAGAILGRAAQVMPDLIPSGGAPAEAVSNFATLRRPGVANSLRAQSALSVSLWDLLSFLGFLRGIQFCDDGHTLIHEKHMIDAWPFLFWETSGADDLPPQLWGLRESHGTSHSGSLVGLPRALRFAAFRQDEALFRDENLDAFRLSEIRQLLVQIGTPFAAVEAESFQFRTFIPLFAHSHQKLDRVVDLLMRHTDETTRRRWVSWFLRKRLGPENESLTSADQLRLNDDVNRVLREDSVVVENAILARCVEFDPVSVLVDYFQHEERDIKPRINELCPLDENGEVTIAHIDRLASAATNRLRRLWVGSPAELERREAIERGRLAGIEVAKALGFPIRETRVRDDINTLNGRLVNLISRAQETQDGNAMLRGIVECARMIEEVLGFVLAFYYLAGRYDPSLATGMPADAAVPTLAGRPTLGRLLRDFRTLCASLSAGAGIASIGARKALLDADTKLPEIHQFTKHRNQEIHASELREADFAHLSWGERITLLRAICTFFDWLVEPAPGHSNARIYPAILHLNLLTTNRCGITSVRYVLKGEDGSDLNSITLYTAQPVAAAPGVFYGVPHQDRYTPQLWVDPVLFAADAFEEAVRRSS
jgi:hypothetical protein